MFINSNMRPHDIINPLLKNIFSKPLEYTALNRIQSTAHLSGFMQLASKFMQDKPRNPKIEAEVNELFEIIEQTDKA